MAIKSFQNHRDTIVQLENDFPSFQKLYEVVYAYYKEHGDRHVSIFDDQRPGNEGKYFVRFLVDRRHVVEYAIVQDRGVCLSGVSLAIGPHYFGAADFWSYEASRRFKLDASTDAVVHNLALLDEFWGYSDALKHAYGNRP